MIYQRGHLARPLDAILGHGSRLAVLRALFGAPEGLSGRQVARRAGINHQGAALALRALGKMGVVSKRASAPAIRWFLERRCVIVEEALLLLFEAESRNVDEVIGVILSRLTRKVDAAVIVGNAARGRLAAGEPLDLIVLCEPNRRRAFQAVWHGLKSELGEKFGLELTVSVLTKREAASSLEYHDGWQVLPTQGRPWAFSEES